MESLRNCEQLVQLVMKSVHPTLNPPEQYGPVFSEFYLGLVTYLKDYKANVPAWLLSRSGYFTELLLNDHRILSTGKAIEVLST